MAEQQCFLEFQHIGKFFPGVKALNNISFCVNEGSVHALMGENGAGKSTLLKILSGFHQPSEGQLCINGQAVQFNSPADALEHRIAVIYQELHVVPEMTVAENIFLGQFPNRGPNVDRRALNGAAEKQLQRLGEDIDPNTPLKYLSIAQWQMVEIAKALSRGAKIIAFDEPTSSLSSREIENLFKVIRDLRSEGRVILYVSHRMEEIFAICDAITVFKDGQHVATLDQIKEVTHDQLVKLMVGREIADVFHYRPRQSGAEGLEVIDLMGPGLSEPANFSVRQGEVVGLFGLIGSGRTELLKLIFGATPSKSGRVRVDGQPVTIRSPQDAIKAGITFSPEDRKSEGIIPIASVKENVNISARPRHALGGFIINEKWETENAGRQVKNLAVKTPNLNQAIRNLSGGNQQKVILGRWLSVEMRVLLLDEPTRGIDVGAKSEIYNLIYELAEKGITVVAVSSDLPEVIGMSDRILVMSNGAICGEVIRPEASEEAVLSMALSGHY